ncbi:MAG: hypothetical protein AAFO07_06275 [Bacteroidota bacterium]
MKAKIILKNFLLFAIMSIMTLACSSPQKMLETGNYDQAISLARKKLVGKNKKKAQYVAALEDAFEKATRRDMQRAEQLKANPSAGNWERVFAVYRSIEKRQQKLEPLLPLVDEYGVKANFRFVNVNPLLIEARANAASAIYEEGQKLMSDARAGDRIAAREAFDRFEDTKRYYPEYKDVRYLMDEASDLGISHVLITLDNRSARTLPEGFAYQLMDLDIRDMNKRWKKYYTRKYDDVPFDYEVKVHVFDIALTPPLVKEEQYQEEREIEDGFEYVLDERGNVKKDTAGNDIKIPKYKIVKALINETFQTKNAQLAGEIEFIDMQNSRVLDREKIAGEAIFNNSFLSVLGDERALSNETKKRLNFAFIPFPSDGDLLFQIIEQIKPTLERKLRSNRVIL